MHQSSVVRSIPGHIRMRRLLPLFLLALLVALFGAGAVQRAHADTQVSVGCSTPTLLTDVNNDGGLDGVTFILAPGCTYTLLNNTLQFSGDVTIIGNGATIEAAYGAGEPAIGGAIVNDGTLRIINLTLYDNKGINGGAIDNENGVLTVTGSTFSYNFTLQGGFGGAIYNDGATATIVNSTFYDNTATGAAAGGGAIANVGGTMTIANSTFSLNGAGSKGGAIYNVGTMDVSGSIFSGNNAITSNKTCLGTITDNGHNVTDDGATCGFSDVFPATDVITTTLAIGIGDFPPADNGGPTPTLAITSSSAAYNIIPAADCPVTDQRGYFRLTDGDSTHCDAGAFEANASPLTVSGSQPFGSDSPGFTYPDLPPGVTGTATCTTVAPQGDTPPAGDEPIVSTLAVGSYTIDPATCSGLSVTGAPDSLITYAGGEFDVTPAAQPDLIIAKSGPATALPGDTITYTMTVTNQGAGPSVAAPEVTDTLPAGLTFDAAATDAANTSNSVTCSATGQDVTCGLPAALPSATGSNSMTFSIVADVANSLAEGTTIENMASVTAQDNESDTTNNTSTPAVETTIQGAPCTTVCYVSTTGSNANTGSAGSPLRTIQFAEDSVSNGGVIIVTDGVYNEAVIIDHPMTLKGYKAGWDARYRTPSFGGETIVDAQGAGQFADAFDVYADNVTIDGFTFEGNDSGVYLTGGDDGYIDGDAVINDIFTDNAQGLYVDSVTDLTVQHDLFEQNNNPAFAGSYPVGDGIYLASGHAIGTASIEANTFSGDEYAAIDISNGFDLEGLTISGNSSTRDGSFVDLANVNDGINAASTISITGNTVSDTGASPATNTGDAIQLEGCNHGPVVISDNTVTNAAGAALLLSDTKGCPGFANDGIVVSKNTFTSDRYSIHALHGGLQPGSGGSAMTVTGNTFKSNKTAAIAIDRGVRTSGLAINDNSIAGNAAGLTDASGQFDATCNWWGSNSGPRATGITNGYGDSVSGLDLASFAPWRTSSNLSFPCDRTLPTATIFSPTAKDYSLHQNVRPVFTCSDAGGSGIASCTVTAGGSNYNVDTTSPGPHIFTVTATDKAGNTTSTSVTYTVG